MAASKLRLLNSSLFQRCSGLKSDYRILKSSFCTKSNDSEKDEAKTPEKYKWVDFHEKQESLVQPPPESNKIESFPTLLRNSKFIDLGDPEGKVVVGTIYHTVGDDLYIDFGWKFHAVCKKPKKFENSYINGTKVKLLIKDLELSTRFLGSTTDITLCEADCVLLGLALN